MPQISVVLPAYNAADTVVRAVRSILGQTLHDFELIVVDDGSSDDTADQVSRLNDPRVRILRLPHEGVASAANQGAQSAVAPLIARMDADDIAHPSRLEKQHYWLHERALDVVGCRVRIVDQAGHSVITMARYERWINDETLHSEEITALRFVELPLVNPTILARREYFDMGFRDKDLPEDYDLMLRAAERGLRFGKVPEILLDWSDRGDRLTRTDPRYSLDAFDRCRKSHLLSGPLRGVREVDLWGLGQTGKPWLRWLQSQGITVRRGYEVNRRKIGKRIHAVPVHHYQDMPVADGTPLIIAVGADGARSLITPHLRSRGHGLGRDAWFVA